MINVLCVSEFVCFLRSTTECMAWLREDIAKVIRCVVFWVLIYFSVIVFRMGSLMGENSGAKAPARGQ